MVNWEAVNDAAKSIVKRLGFDQYGDAQSAPVAPVEAPVVETPAPVSTPAPVAPVSTSPAAPATAATPVAPETDATKEATA
uniref:Uncharacterized protein n=1 Tax=uncultured organism TaxID=155900 RepID=A0A7L9QC77_9ZZZZ|nr:hypothetical protein [uncultured organism]